MAEVSAYRSFVIYGRSNTGKTTLASTFPGPILFLDVRDRGTDSIADVEDIDVMKIHTFEDFEKVYWFLKKHPKRYKTVVVDTMSMLQQIVIQERAAENKKDVSEAGSWGSMTKKDWGDVSALMKEWVINYRDLTDVGINVVFIAQDRVFNVGEDEDEDNNAIAPEVGPALSPSIAKVLNASVTVIGNTFIREKKVEKKVEGKKVVKKKIQYCLRIGPNPTYVTKVRKPRSVTAPAYIVDPTYEAIIEVIKGE